MVADLFDPFANAFDGAGLVGGIDATTFGPLTQAAEEAAEVTRSSHVPFFGPATDAISVANGGVDAYCGFQNGDSDAAWEGIGKSINGALGLMSEVDPAFNAAVTGFQVGADLIGAESGRVQQDTAFSADTIVGEILRGQLGDKAMGSDFQTPIQNGDTRGIMHAFRMSQSEPVQALNLLDTVAGGLVNWSGNMYDRDDPSGKHENKDDYWGAAKAYARQAAKGKGDSSDGVANVIRAATGAFGGLF